MTTDNCFLLPNEILPPPSKVLDWVSNSSPIFHEVESKLLGSAEPVTTDYYTDSAPCISCSSSMVNFDEGRGQKAKKRSFFPQLDNKENSTNEDDYDVCFHQAEKKIRRLLPKQVEFLEKSFEVENKLEPERKVQLAKEIGLQPRQVAIWFQNRRARYKAKQIEKDYDVLKASFDKLKDEFDCLFKENESLRNEIHLLKEKFLNRVNDEENSEPTSQLDEEGQNPIGVVSNLGMVVCKQEDASSAKSDILDSDSPRFTDGDCNSFLEPNAHSAHVFETEASDFSQEDDTSLLHPLLCFPKLEEVQDLRVNSSNLGFQIEDQSWFCHY